VDFGLFDDCLVFDRDLNTMAKRPAGQTVGWLFNGGLFLAVLYFANLTASHAWAASFSTPNRE
jgi:hypothetical protein